MSISPALPQSAAQELLQELCARNQSSDLLYQSPRDERFRAKVRLLELNDDQILIDMPVVSGRPLILREGDTVSLYLAHEGQRLTFTTTVTGRQMSSVSGAAPIPVLRIAVPDTIEQSQRRECYRLSTVHMTSAQVKFRVPEAAPDAEPIRGLMVNLSETGCGVVFDLSVAKLLKPGQLLIAGFTMPEEPEAFTFEAEVQWLVPDTQSERLRVGFAWDMNGASPEMRQQQMRLGKYIVAEQRRILRRQRMREE